jgi:hypothetical protein
MATQDTQGIPFSSAQVQQSFKLLELPPDLIAMLESDSPPTYVSAMRALSLAGSSAPANLRDQTHIVVPSYHIACSTTHTRRYHISHPAEEFIESGADIDAVKHTRIRVGRGSHTASFYICHC